MSEKRLGEELARRWRLGVGTDEVVLEHKKRRGWGRKLRRVGKEPG